MHSRRLQRGSVIYYPLWFFLGVFFLLGAEYAVAEPNRDGSRLAYLEESDPFHPGLKFPKLTTPQWVGEVGVEAVVILSIDDMSATAPYEKYLRPILERLKKING